MAPSVKNGPAEKTTKTVKRENDRLAIQFVIDYALDKDQKSSIKGKKDAKLASDYFFDFAANLGSGGVFIKTQTPQDVDETLTLKFTVPGSRKKVKVQGKVMWVQESDPQNTEITAGMGVQFIDLPHDIRNSLVEYIAEYLGNDDTKVA